LPQFEVDFGSLDASALQAAILGAQEKGTMLSTLIERLHPSSSAPAWPQSEGTVKADSMVLGPVTLHSATATLRILDNGVHVTALDASLLGGHVHAAGSLYEPSNDQKKPAYMVEAQFEKLAPAAVGQLVAEHWSGGSFDANGKIELTGFTATDLSATAKGLMHFDWQHGTVAGAVPAALARFDRWTADAVVGSGGMKLGQNEAKRGTQSAAVEGNAVFGTPNKVTFAMPKEALAK
jgi:hypothetical protein